MASNKPIRRVLITGSRAVVALELARALAARGIQVYSADSLQFPILRFSRVTTRHYKIASPQQGLEGYANELITIIKRHKIDLLIPVCEETFYISQAKARLGKYCEVFCDDIDKLARLHSKWAIQAMVRAAGGLAPRTFRIKNKAELVKYVPSARDMVFKPEFSRFASKVLVSPSEGELLAAEASTADMDWNGELY